MQSEDLIELGKHWCSVAGKKYAFIFDKVYDQKLRKHFDELNQIILVVEKGHQIIGMVLGGELPTGQAWGSVLKYTEGIPGLSEILSIEFARGLNKIGPNVELLNVSSSNPSLRHQSYPPGNFWPVRGTYCV